MARCCSPTPVRCCNLRKQPVIGWRRRAGTVRLGVVEEVAGGSLPAALGRFATFNPGVKLEVQIGISAELIEELIRLLVGIVMALGVSRASRHTHGCGWMRVDSIHLPLALSTFTI